MARHQISPITTLGTELGEEILEIKLDLVRIQKDAREAGDWKKELAVMDRRLKIVEMRLREVREHSTNILSVNFDVDEKTASKMALAFLSRQRLRETNGGPDDN